MEPLGRHVQHETVLSGHRHAGLGAERRLVLHADLVLAGDHDGRRGGLGLAEPHRLVPEVLPRGDRFACVAARFEDLVLDLDELGGASGEVEGLGGDDRDRLPW
nr:hypothetical protein GCM10025732_17720 [Glycomyces mayteni]